MNDGPHPRGSLHSDSLSCPLSTALDPAAARLTTEPTSWPHRARGFRNKLPRGHHTDRGEGPSLGTDTTAGPREGSGGSPLTLR